MPRLRQHWLALAFVLLGLAAVLGLFLLASGRWRIGSELPGLLVGGVLAALLWAAVARR